MLYGFNKSVQILITTHSPSFYLLDEYPNFINYSKVDTLKIYTYLVDEHIKNGLQITSKKDIRDIDYKMGWLPIFSKKYPEIIEDINKLTNELSSLKYNKINIFLEGSTDELIINKALDFWSIEYKLNKENISVFSCGSSTNLKNKLIGCAYLGICGIGFFDKDAYFEYNSAKNEIESIKHHNVLCYIYPQTKVIKNIYSKNITLNYELEDLYPFELTKSNYKVPRSRFDLKNLPQDMNQKDYLKKKFSVFEESVKFNMSIICLNKFDDRKKVKLAKQLCNKDKAYWDENMFVFKEVISKIKKCDKK